MINELIYGIIVIFCIILAVIIFNAICNKSKRNKGLVIIGYPGVGKSTLADKNRMYIDLDSSEISKNNNEDWFIDYCDMAYELANKGHVVFTSSHDVVRKYFENTWQSSGVDVYTCFPSKSMKSKWLLKLESRWELSESEKDFKAWQRAVSSFDEDIADMKSSPLPSIIISSISYDLDTFIKSL